MKNKGQVTIFIIVGIVIVVGIIAFIFFSRRTDIDNPSNLEPKAFVDKCVRDAVEDSVQKMLANGGEIVPSLAITYQGDEWNYLCYQGDYYLGCYNIHPMLEMQIEKEIVLDTQDDVENCFIEMEKDFENKGFDISSGESVYSIDLLPGYIEINLEKRVDISEGENSQSFENFDAEIVSPIYNLVQISRDVVNSESQFANFEYNGYMLLYPQYEIRRIDYSDSKIYRLIDRKSGYEFKFAVRSGAFPPGI